MDSQSGFEDPGPRYELFDRLSGISAFRYPRSEETIRRRPSVALVALVEPEEFTKLEKALTLTWFFDTAATR